MTFEATDALPGSEEKIRVLTERATARLPLFHPADPVIEHAFDRQRPREKQDFSSYKRRRGVKDELELLFYNED